MDRSRSPPVYARQPHPVPHARLLKRVPVRQVPRQPVDIPDDDHIDRSALDRRDQLPEPVPGHFLERRVPVIFEGSHHRPAAPGRVGGAPVQLGRHRLGGVVGLAQTAVHARPERGLRPVFLRVVHESSMTQNHSDRSHSAVACGAAASSALYTSAALRPLAGARPSGVPSGAWRLPERRS